MLVRDGMSSEVLVIGPAHTVHEAAQRMAARKVGAVVVHDPENDGVGILTERDVLEAFAAAGEGAGGEPVAEHLTSDLVFAAPDWPLERAAAAMMAGGFRHLVVLDGGEVAGILSVRDIVRCWSDAKTPA